MNNSWNLRTLNSVEVVQVVKKLVDIRNGSMDRDLIFNPGIAKLLYELVGQINENDELKRRFSVDYEVDINSAFYKRKKELFHEAMVEHFGPNYKNEGDDFVLSQWNKFISPFVVRRSS